MDLFGVRLIGVNLVSLHKALLSVVVIAIAFGVRALLRTVNARQTDRASRRGIWIRKTIALVVGGLAVFLLLSIWFTDPHQMAVFGGLIGAGVAFASQNAMLSFAGFFVIVFGKVFDMGHRIELGGVRGDVLDIGLFKTTIMEMGVPVQLQPDPSHWVGARQYTGRVVTVANSEVFKKPVYNYSVAFDLLWEELRLPVKYGTDLKAASRILVEAAGRETAPIVERGRRELKQLPEKYLIEPGDLEPRVFVRLTDNWVELSLRFMVETHGVREVKDRLSREILTALDAAGIGIASATYDVVGVPEVKVRVLPSP